MTTFEITMKVTLEDDRHPDWILDAVAQQLNEAEGVQEYNSKTSSIAEQKEHHYNNNMTRYEKVDHLLETCSPSFIKECSFLLELVAWMDEDDFAQFYDNVCSKWDIAKTPEEYDRRAAWLARLA